MIIHQYKKIRPESAVVHNTRGNGSVLLISLLVSSVGLAVGIGVYNRIYKELLFASFWKQTQVAFTAADSGLECVLYWDLHPPVSGEQASCFDGGTTFSIQPNPSSGSLVTKEVLSSVIVSNGCVTVLVIKDNSTGTTITTIEARGMDSCNSLNPRRVERGLGVRYE